MASSLGVQRVAWLRMIEFLGDEFFSAAIDVLDSLGKKVWLVERRVIFSRRNQLAQSGLLIAKNKQAIDRPAKYVFFYEPEGFHTIGLPV